MNPSASHLRLIGGYSREIAAVLAIAFAGCLGILWMTRDGVGLSPDSRGYFHAAENFAAGRGPLMPAGNGQMTLQTHLAPGYGVWLGTIRAATGADVRSIARFWNAIAWFVSIGLVALGVWMASGRKRAPTLMAAALAALSGPMLLTHVMLWSESTFIACLLTTVVALGMHVGTSRWSTIVVAGLATAGALMCRYAGASLVLAGTWAVFGLANAPLRRRLLDTFVFGLLSCAPMLAWIIYGKLQTGTTANRELAFKGLPTLDHLTSFLSTLGSFTAFSSGKWPVWTIGAIAAGLLVFVALAAWLLERFIRTGTQAAVSAHGRLAPTWLFVLVYPLFLLFSISFFDAHTPLDARILAPWHAALIVAVVGSIAAGPSAWRRLTGMGFVVVLVLQLVGAITFLSNSSRDSLGFAAEWWNRSPAIAWLRTVEPNTPIYADIPEAVDFLVDQQWAKPLFRTLNPSTKRRATPADIDKALSGIRRELGLDPGRGYVVYFKPKRAREKYTIAPDQLIERLGLEVVKKFDGDDSIILGPTERTRLLAIEHREKDRWYAGESSTQPAEPTDDR